MRKAHRSLCPPQRLARLSVLSSLIVLSACGGGSSDSSDSPDPAPAPTPPAPSAVTISGKAVDGPLSGATACYDLNDNGTCDSGEPSSAATGTDGSFSLAVAAADVGKHRIVVQVPATAIDADTGAAVGTAFTLLAPATGSSGAHSVFVSPLSTLVQSHVDATGVTIAEAAALVQAQAGLASRRWLTSPAPAMRTTSKPPWWLGWCRRPRWPRPRRSKQWSVKPTSAALPPRQARCKNRCSAPSSAR